MVIAFVTGLYSTDMRFQPTEAVCPECGLTIKCGLGGSSNLERHVGGESCRKQKERLVKEKKSGKKGMKSFMDNFFRPKGTAQVPSTVASSSASGMSRRTHTPIPVPGHEPPPAPAQISRSAVLDRFRQNIERLPFEGSSPSASVSGIFGGFAADPITYYPDLAAPADTICEEYLIPLLDQMLQGKGAAEISQHLCRGPNGLDGFLRFLTHFVTERGVSDALLEPRVDRIKAAIDLV